MTLQSEYPEGLVDRYGRPLAYRRDAPPATRESFDTSSSLGFAPGYMANAMMQVDLSKLDVGDYRAMRSHPQVNASLSVLTFMIHQVDWSIECEDSKIVDQITDNMKMIWTRLIRAMSQSFWAGYSPCVLEWENDSAGRWVVLNKIKDLPPEDCSIVWKEVSGGYRPPGSQITPKVKVFDGIRKMGMSYDIPVEHTFWYPCLMENGNWYGRKLLGAAFMPWYFSILLHLYQVRYLERFGEPTPIGRAPFDETYVRADGGKLTGKEVMEGILMNLRSRGAVTLPSDRDTNLGNVNSQGKPPYLWDIEYLESQMRGADFERALARLDEEISLAIFTPTLLMRTGDVGSHNLGVQQTQLWLWMVNAIMGDMKEYIDRYIVERMKAYNFSPNAPKAEWVPRKLGKDSIDTVRQVMVSLINAGLAKPDLDELGAALGMTVKEIKQVTQPPPTPADTRTRPENATGDAAPPSAGDSAAGGSGSQPIG
jgi:hypothetical protein